VSKPAPQNGRRQSVKPKSQNRQHFAINRHVSTRGGFLVFLRGRLFALKDLSRHAQGEAVNMRIESI